MNTETLNILSTISLSMWVNKRENKLLMNGFYLQHNVGTVCREELEEWVEVLDDVLLHCKQACAWMLEYISSEDGSQYIR